MDLVRPTMKHYSRNAKNIFPPVSNFFVVLTGAIAQ